MLSRQEVKVVHKVSLTLFTYGDENWVREGRENDTT